MVLWKSKSLRRKRPMKIFPLSGNRLIDVFIGLLIALMLAFAGLDIYASSISPSSVNPSGPVTPQIEDDDFDDSEFFDYF